MFGRGNAGAFGGEVHGRPGHARYAGEHTLHPGDTGGAGHAFDGEIGCVHMRKWGSTGT